jgi:hypothetical protein
MKREIIMRLDYVVTLKNDYTEKEMLALCEQCNDETRSKDAIEFFAPMLIDVDRTTSFEQEGFVLHLHKNSEDDRPMALYEASNSKLSYDEWWDRTFKLKEGKVKVELQKGKWAFLCRGAASRGAFELLCVLKTLKIPFNSISYWLRDEYAESDFAKKK